MTGTGRDELYQACQSGKSINLYNHIIYNHRTKCSPVLGVGVVNHLSTGTPKIYSAGFPPEK